MTVQKSFTFFSNSANQVNWTLIDATGASVNTAAVTATLYWGRDRLKPDQIPGIAINGFSAVDLVFASGIYSVVIPALDTLPNGGDYILVVDAVDGSGNPLAHWERPAVVVQYGP